MGGAGIDFLFIDNNISEYNIHKSIEECFIPVPSAFNLVRLRNSLGYLKFENQPLGGANYTCLIKRIM